MFALKMCKFLLGYLVLYGIFEIVSIFFISYAIDQFNSWEASTLVSFVVLYLLFLLALYLWARNIKHAKAEHLKPQVSRLGLWIMAVGIVFFIVWLIPQVRFIGSSVRYEYESNFPGIPPSLFHPIFGEGRGPYWLLAPMAVYNWIGLKSPMLMLPFLFVWSTGPLGYLALYAIHSKGNTIRTRLLEGVTLLSILVMLGLVLSYFSPLLWLSEGPVWGQIGNRPYPQSGWVLMDSETFRASFTFPDMLYNNAVIRWILERVS